MEDGHVQMKSELPGQPSIADCWFVSKQNTNWLVLPFYDQKEAYRCLQCGTTLILRGT
jgi:hypothetical protein